MLRITDKSFRYTPSFNTDLKKKFRQMERDRRAAVEGGKIADAATNSSATNNSVVPITRRAAPKA